jgi:hypothetical protein
MSDRCGEVRDRCPPCWMSQTVYDPVRKLAAEAGRDPANIVHIFRAYPTEESTMDQVIEAITGTRTTLLWTRMRRPDGNHQ